MESQEPLLYYVERGLTEDDLTTLDRPIGSKAPDLVRLSGRHHRLARMIAEGFSPGEAGSACNYSSSRVSILLDMPVFQELVTFYRAKVDEQYLKLHDKLAQLSETAAGILQDRLEDQDEKFTSEDLRKIVEMGATHVVGKKVEVQVGFADRLDRARERLRALPSPIIDVEAEEITNE